MLFNLDVVPFCLKSPLAACLLICCHIFSLGNLILNRSRCYLLFTVAFNHVIPSSAPHSISVSVCVTSVSLYPEHRGYTLQTSTKGISEHSCNNAVYFIPLVAYKLTESSASYFIAFTIFSLFRILEGEGGFYCNPFCHVNMLLFPTP